MNYYYNKLMKLYKLLFFLLNLDKEKLNILFNMIKF